MSTQLLFGVHCHQPVDNFDWAVQEALERSYLPFFEHVAHHEHFVFSVHFSGWLLQKIEQDYPELFNIFVQLSQRGQIEWLSGGFYEPILAAISSQDRRDQIEKLNHYIEQKFNQIPKGLWLAERVYDESIIADIAACGITYTCVDDYHFKRVAQMHTQGYFVTESAGTPLNIFAINKALRYALPFLDVNEAIAQIKQQEVAIHFDDGEKFGLWPNTYEWVYDKQWLSQFLEQLKEEPSITTTTFSHYMQNNLPQSLIYLPNVSYYEMGEWSLNAEAILLRQEAHALLQKHFSDDACEQLLGGGVWKNFFAKYSESNHIHKRLLALSQLRTKVQRSDFDDALFKAQANDALWHGVFGGVYLPNLRDNCYRYLIEAERIAYENSHQLPQRNDIDFDGYDEILLANKPLVVLISEKAAMVKEFDWRLKAFNLQNCMMRRIEAYHNALLHPKTDDLPSHDDTDDATVSIHDTTLSIDENTRSHIINDWYERGSFLYHITDEGFNLHNFHTNTFAEYGDFVNQPYSTTALKKNEVSLTREGGIYIAQRAYATAVTKTFKLKKQSLESTMQLHTQADTAGLHSMVECNFHFASYTHLTFNEKLLNDGIDSLDAPTLTIIDPHLNFAMTLEASQSVQWFITPIKSVALSERGVDLTTQGVAIALLFDSVEASITLTATLKEIA